MNEKQLLQKINLPSVFIKTLVGFASGLLGTIVLGLILLLTWSIVGDILTPTNQQVTNQFGEILTYKEDTHPLFLSVVIWAVFMATLAANVLQTVLNSAIEERYTARATSLTHVAVGNIVILIMMIPLYMMVSSKYGATGVAIAALIHSTLTVMFSVLAIEILALKLYTLISVYGVIAGMVLFFVVFNLFGTNSPTLVAFSTLPLLLGLMAFGSGITQLLYFWFADTYGNDFLDLEKRYGADYGRAEKDEAVEDYSEEFGEI